MQNKHAELKSKLQPHQQEALKRGIAGNLLLSHSTGSGKTLTSIAIADAIGKPTVVLTPASLVDNYKKELAKHLKKGPKFDVRSISTAVKQRYNIPEGATLVIDEAHSLRNSDTARTQYIKEQAPRAGRIIAMTGTPAYNQLYDYAPLMNIVAGESVLPEDPKAFRERYVDEKKIPPTFFQRLRGVRKAGVIEHLKNGDILKKKLAPYIHNFQADIEKPDREDVAVDVPFEEYQGQLYDALDGQLPAWARMKLKYGLPPDKQELSKMNMLLSGVRQVANTAEGFKPDAARGAKIVAAADSIAAKMKDNPKLRALVYSNFLSSGVEPFAKELDKRNISYGVYTGALTAKKKKSLVDAYNSGKLTALLVSGSGSEGLDLKNTNLIQILEPHWNNSRIDQVIGRGIRYKSHAELPPEQRKVLVEKYFSKRRNGDNTVDQYLTQRAAEKAALIQEMKDALQA